MSVCAQIRNPCLDDLSGLEADYELYIDGTMKQSAFLDLIEKVVHREVDLDACPLVVRFDSVDFTPDVSTAFLALASSPFMKYTTMLRIENSRFDSLHACDLVCQAVKELRGLRGLSLSRTELDDAYRFDEAISTLPELNYLDLDESLLCLQASRRLMIIRRMPSSVTQLNLSTNGLTTDDVRTIINILPKDGEHSQLEDLILSYNHSITVTPELIDRIKCALPRLRELSFDDDNVLSSSAA